MILACFGDSITEGYLVNKDKSWPSVLEKISDGLIKTINLGSSGDTTYNAIIRLNDAINSGADALFIEFGINDFFMGLPIVDSRKNLENIISSALKNQMKVILAGFSFKAQGSEKWEKMYEDLANRFSIYLYKNIFNGIDECKFCFLPDGLHPNEKGYEIIAQNIYSFLQEIRLF